MATYNLGIPGDEVKARLLRNDFQAVDALPASGQDGVLYYLKAAVGTRERGFYYWNGTAFLAVLVPADVFSDVTPETKPAVGSEQVLYRVAKSDFYKKYKLSSAKSAAYTLTASGVQERGGAALIAYSDIDSGWETPGVMYSEWFEEDASATTANRMARYWKDASFSVLASKYYPSYVEKTLYQLQFYKGNEYHIIGAGSGGGGGGGGGTAAVDGRTIGYNESNELYVKNAGVDSPQIKGGAVVFEKLAGELVSEDLPFEASASDERLPSEKSVSVAVKSLACRITVEKNTTNNRLEFKLYGREDPSVPISQGSFSLSDIAMKITSLDFDEATGDLVLKWINAEGEEKETRVPSSSLLANVLTISGEQEMFKKTINFAGANKNTAQNMPFSALAADAVATDISSSPVNTKLATEKAVADALAGIGGIDWDASTLEFVPSDTGADKEVLTIVGTDASTIGVLNAPFGTDNVVLQRKEQPVTNKTIDADSNTISNLETDNLKSGILRTSTGGFQTVPDDLHIVSEKLIKDYTDEEIRKAKESAFRFVGYFSAAAPAQAKKGELWFAATELPTMFPIQVHTYDGTAWSTDVTPYTPANFETWSLVAKGSGWYWFGNGWNRIDATGEIVVDNITIGKTASGELQVKNAGIDTAQMKDGAVATEKIANESVVKTKIDPAAKVVFEDDAQTLTQKTIDADNNAIGNLEVDNLKDGVLQTEVTAASTDLQIPTAKAAYDSVKDLVPKTRKVAGVDLADDITAQEVQDAIKEVSVELKNKTIDADSNTVSNLGGSNLKPKTAADKGKAWVVQSDGSWDLGKAGSDVDNVTIEEAAGKLRVKDGGISTAKIASNSVTYGKLDEDLTCETVSSSSTDEELATGKAVYNAVKDLVPKTRKVAGVDLADDITAAEVQDAIKNVSAELKNKTINADSNAVSNLEVDNLKNGVLQTAISAESTDAQIPSAKAAYDAVKDLVPKTRKVAGVDLADDITAQEVQDAIKELAAVLKNKTIDAGNNTVSNLGAGNFKPGVIDVSTLYTTDNTHLASSRLIASEIEKAKKGFQFTGYVSPADSAPSGAKAGELWYASDSSVMPTEFPIAVSKYDGSSWSTAMNYTPESLHLWANLNNNHGYYWFGNSWNLLDFNAGVDNTTIEYDARNLLSVKNGGVTTAKIADNAVTAVKIADLGVTGAKIANLAVTSGKIADNAIVEGKIADGAVVTAKLADEAVTNAKIGNSAVESEKIADSAVLEAKIADGAVSLAKMKPAETDKAEQSLVVGSDGAINIGWARNYKAVNTFEGETGNTKILYYLTRAYDAYAKGLYRWNGSSYESLAESGGGDVVSKAIAPLYVEQAYSIGDIVMHDGKRHTALVNITTPETWTASHWSEKSVQESLGEIEGKSFKNVTELTETDNRTIYNLTQQYASYPKGMYRYDDALGYYVRVDVPTIIDTEGTLPTIGILSDAFYKVPYTAGYTFHGRHDLTQERKSMGWTTSAIGLYNGSVVVTWNSVASGWDSGATYSQYFERNDAGQVYVYQNDSTSAYSINYASPKTVTGFKLYVYNSVAWHETFDSEASMSDYLKKSGDTMTGVLTFSNGKSDTDKLDKSGGTMTGELNMGSQKITNLATPTANTDASTKKYVDDKMQAFYNGIFPVGFMLDAPQAPGVPSGVSATWTDVSSTVNGRYLQVSTDAAGTTRAEQLPNITGGLTTQNETPANWAGITGALSVATGSDDGYTGHSANNRPRATINFNAHDSNSIYTDSGKVQPLTVTVKRWKRTA